MSRRKDELRALFGGTATAGEPELAPERKSTAPGGEQDAGGREAVGQEPVGQEPVGQGRSGEKGGKPAAEPASPPAPAPAPAPATARSGSGAVRAMGLQLGALKAEAEEARALRTSVARGERVVEIDPMRIDPAFLSDRLAMGEPGDESFASLKEAIRRDGQQVPVLLRPHPDAARAAEGRYQSAYGHRRILAARELDLPVRAIVRPLTDEELVLAQGQENSERRDLTFIERAVFARAMLARGFERTLAQSALGVEKTEMSRLLQVAENVPDYLIRAIGPAPKAGRGRWMELAAHFQTERGRERAHALLLTDTVRALASDARVSRLVALFNERGDTARRKPAELASLRAVDGTEIATLKRARRGTSITLPDGDFAAFLAREIPSLHERFLGETAADDDGD